MKAQQPDLTLITRRSLLAGGAAGTALALLGCGGGDSLAGVGSGGTGSFGSGPIRGLGSIVVGGVHFNEATATIVGDGGGTLASDALRLGMVVEVEASDIRTERDGKRRADATTVGVRSEIEGPITAIGTDTLTVLGQVVELTPATVFDDDLRGGLSSLRVHQIVEVYGLLQPNGRYIATRIDDEDDVGPYKLRGRVSKLNAAARTFQIGTTLVSYAGITPVGATLAEGSYVRVELQSAEQGGTWIAIGVRVYGAGIALPPTDRDGVKVEIEGYITALASERSFSVSGIKVDASGVRWLPAGLAVGVRVEVEGRFANGLLTATEVEIEDDDDDDEFEIEGTIDSVDAALQTLSIRGVTVDYSRPSVRFKGGNAAALAPGVKIEVEGHLDVDGVTLIATEIEFDDDDDEAEIEGRISNLDRSAQTFMIRDVTVGYSGATFEDGSAADLADGVQVAVEGRFSADGRILVASVVEFDD